MSCEHDISDMDTACHCDGMCPLCLAADNEKLREKIKELKKDIKAAYGAFLK